MPQVNVPQVVLVLVVVPKDATQARVFMGIAGGAAKQPLFRGWTIRMRKIGSFNRGVVFLEEKRKEVGLKKNCLLGRA